MFVGAYKLPALKVYGRMHKQQSSGPWTPFENLLTPSAISSAGPLPQPLAQDQSI